MDHFDTAVDPELPVFDLSRLNSFPRTAQIAWEAICRNTTDHTLTILQDSPSPGDNYRHLRMSKGTSYMWSWDIVTWPGHLSITGDIADGFTFRRTANMMDFFRRETNPLDEPYNPAHRPSLNISYRAEKITRAQSTMIQELNPIALIDTVVDTVQDIVVEEHVDHLTGQRILDSYGHLVNRYHNGVIDGVTDALREWLETHLLEYTGDITDYNPMDYTLDFYLAIYAIDKAVIEYYRHHANR